MNNWYFADGTVQPAENPDFGPIAKRGMNDASPESKTWFPTTVDSLVREADQQCEYMLQLHLDPELQAKYGGPGEIWVNVTLERNPQLTALVTIDLFDKVSTRMAEAMFVSFVPVANPKTWAMDVIGWSVSPLEVVYNGSRHLHAVWEGVNNTNVAIKSFDTPLVCPGDAEHLLLNRGFVSPDVPDMTGGWHWNLMNNHWGVAFPQVPCRVSGRLYLRADSGTHILTLTRIYDPASPWSF